MERPLRYDQTVEAIVSMLMELQDRENIELPLYEQQLREAETAIGNLLNAIQQGILTKSTKTRLEELEDRKEELETLIACEKLAKPKISAEFMTFWLHRFRELDVKKKEHRQMLIDAFVNAIFLYDDKLLITFNYKEGSKTITFDDVKGEATAKASGSDIDCSAAPRQNNTIRSSAAAGGVRSTDGVVFPFQTETTALGFGLVFVVLRIGYPATSSQAAYRLRRFFMQSIKNHLALTPPLLLSNLNPLRWASSWFLVSSK